MSAATIFIKGLTSRLDKRLIVTHPLPEGATRHDLKTSDSTPVHAPDAYLARYYQTDLGIGLTETADDIRIEAAVCKVTRDKNIVSTAITGRNGTVKELISAKDYEIEATFDILSSSDEYPEQALRRLADLANENSPVYLDSAFLRIFDIDRAVVEKMVVDQTTDGNRQEVTMKLVSDDDYEVAVHQDG